MSIQYASDLHLEFEENGRYIKDNPLQVKGEVLILAGDIVPIKILDDYGWFFDWCAKNYKYTYWVLGNHDWYGSIICNDVSTSVRNNVFIVNNMSVLNKEEKVRYIFTSLWSKISPANALKIQGCINDFRLIKYNNARFTVDRFNQMHESSIAFLKSEFAKKDDYKKIVVTHHVPTLMNYPEQYRISDINEAFATELYDMIESSEAVAWIYGHHHVNIPEFKIGNTRMLTNQLGYIHHGEHTTFLNDKIIQL